MEKTHIKDEFIKSIYEVLTEKQREEIKKILTNNNNKYE